MNRSARLAIFYILCLAGSEAARMSASSEVARKADVKQHSQVEEAESTALAIISQTQKTMDLDWPGCGSKSGFYAWWCESTPGCANQPLWLDTPRQKCRFTDDFKMKREEMANFLPVELDRLVEKSETFQRTGCLFGGWWAKCFRRMRQIVRLLGYVKKAVAEAKKDPTHPAYAMASSDDTVTKLQRVADNLSSGFKKHEGGEDGANFGEAYNNLKKMPDELRETAETAEAKGYNLSPEQKAAMEKAGSVEAFLSMTGTKLTDAQRAKLMAMIEADEATNNEGTEQDMDAAVEEVTKELDNAMEKADKEDMEHLHEQDTVDFDGADIEDERAHKDDPNDHASLMEEKSTLNSTVVTRGTGPLKWIFQHGLGWIVSRVAWLLLFLVGAALGIIRAGVIFPLLFVSCTLLKFIVWVFRDVGYNLLWEGEMELVGNRFKQIGTCAPMAWDFVGFDATSPNLGEVAAEVVVQPARFASHWTGVHHAYKSAADLCKDVQCGSNAQCKAGKCLCNMGFFPVEKSPNCDMQYTKNGCVCKSVWTESTGLGLFTSTHFGCPAGKWACQVDTTHPSFKTCESKLPTTSSSDGMIGQILKWTVGTTEKPKADRCTTGKARSEVPAVSG